MSVAKSVTAQFAARHTKRGVNVDPCPTCGTMQAEHWTCRLCASRGHITGRGRRDTTICEWCEAELDRKRSGLEVLVAQELAVNASTK